MAIIGKLTKQADGSYKGSISTLAITGRNITMRPVEDDKLKPGAPVYRIFSGFGEAGAVFEANNKDTGEVYLSMKLDDPTFPAPVYGAIFPNKEKPESELDLVWSRPKQA
jgi:uncharacterized protein (DUF736 family)